MTNQDYKNAALDALKGNWAQALIATIVLFLVASVCMSGDILTNLGVSVPMFLLVGGFSVIYLLYLPLTVGYLNSFRVLYETGDNRLTNNMFALCFGNWLHIVWGMILMVIFVMLWTLLFIIPGIVKSFSYAMTPFILVEHPEMSANQAIDESRRIMKGHKFDLFYLYLSFIGWAFLCLFTFGIGYLWLVPYMQASLVAFYNDVKGAPAGANEIEAERVL